MISTSSAVAATASPGAPARRTWGSTARAIPASDSTSPRRSRAAQTRNGQRLTARLGEGELQVRVEDNHLTPVTLSLLD